MYSAKIDGQPTTFGTSGLLYRSNKLMYDRKTNTLWSSLIGRPVIGSLAEREDLKLDFFPIVLTTWEEWLEEHPETEVLSIETGYYSRALYGPETDSDSIYYDYRVSAETMFPIWDRDTRLDIKDEVLGLSVDDVHKAYPVVSLRDLRVVNDTVGGREFVILSSDTSSDVRVFERNGQTFSLEEGSDGPGVPDMLIDSDGVMWEVHENGLRSTRDETEVLMRRPSHLSFWFGWFTFHPDTLLFEPE